MTPWHLIFISIFALSACTTSLANRDAPATQLPAARFFPAACEVGIYGNGSDGFIAVTHSETEHRYAFDDRRVGRIGAKNQQVECGSGSVLVNGTSVWAEIPIRQTDTRFVSGHVALAGRLLEPIDADANTPLVVYAHGSERSDWIESFRDPYQMVGRGISVFVYDKRGTGLSEGNYSQNFPKLADDLVAAADEARSLAGARFGRFGLVGLSQGGWIAPLAAGRARADFIAIGYGLVADIREEDAAQVQKELRDAGYANDILTIARAITDVTARIAQSEYTDGLEELAQIQRQYSSEEWFPLIRGGYTGVLLNSSVDDLRRRGVPQFNDLDVDWSLSPMEVLSDVKVPQLWVLAGEDREAPIDLTLERLKALSAAGSEITIYVFPETDHGMWEYKQAADGSRDYLKVTSGYYDLMADYIGGQTRKRYGRSQIIDREGKPTLISPS